MYPIELWINEIDNNIIFKILFTSGALDTEYPLAFHDYLRKVNTNKRISFSEPIKGIDHTVTIDDKEYFDLIFRK